MAVYGVVSLQFEQENEQLFDQMSTMVDEVRQIEGKVLEISRLQEIFTDKVLEQVRGLNPLATRRIIQGVWLVGGIIYNNNYFTFVSLRTVHLLSNPRGLITG